MKFYVGVTDNSWYDYLSQHNFDEINFWQPNGGGRRFRALSPGELFLFKLKRPNNHIAGGGTFIGEASMPLSLAWETFGHKNGAASRDDMFKLISAYRKDKAADPEIGCIILSSPFFVSPKNWMNPPSDWSSNIVQGKSYQTDVRVNYQYLRELNSRLSTSEREHNDIATESLTDSVSELTSRTKYVMSKQRLGQSSFRAFVTLAYKRRCAITGENTLPVLEAAHIRPYSESGPNQIDNGLLLRSDFHTLFDRGFVTVTPEYKVLVSDQIQESYFNGKVYYRLHQQKLASIPDEIKHQPSQEYLEWHNREIFHS